MAEVYGNFWTGVVVGWIVMVILGALLPVLGPIIGGFVAGWIARGGTGGGAKAGAVAGIFGAIVIAVILIVFGTALLGGIGFLAGLGTSIVVIISTFLYFGILGLIGGAIAGAVRTT